MGRFTVILDDDLENRFRKVVERRFGGRRGAITAAVAEAIILWLRKYEEGD